MSQTDLSVYQPPGVYVSDTSLPYADAINPVLSARVMCIVAPALGYQQGSDEITLFSATGSPLSHTGVIQDATLTVTTMTGTALVLNSDYSVSVDSSDPTNPVTSLKRLPSNPATVSPSGVADGDSVIVTYNYTDSTYYQPQLYSDFSSLAEAYGPDLATSASATSQVVSPLTLAAKIAFENGASQIYTIAVTGTDAASYQTAFRNAYAKIATNQNIDLVVPIFPETIGNTGASYSGLLVDLRSHVDQAYANGFARMAIAGAPASYDETVPYVQAAEAVKDKRIALVYPTQVQMLNSNTSQTITVGGGYAAAAVAGRLMLNPVERGVTRQVLNTVTSMPLTIQQKMSKAFMDSLAIGGTLVLMLNRNGRLTVRHGITTDPTSLLTREISLVRIGDTLLVDVQQALDAAGLIGEPITADTTTQVQSILVGALEQEMANQVIVSYAGVSVLQQSLPTGDPSVIDCRFSYKPAAPLNYITVEFSLDMTFGQLTPATTATADTTTA